MTHICVIGLKGNDTIFPSIQNNPDQEFGAQMKIVKTSRIASANQPSDFAASRLKKYGVFAHEFSGEKAISKYQSLFIATTKGRLLRSVTGIAQFVVGVSNDIWISSS